MAFDPGQNVIVSPISNKAFFKNKLGRLCNAPVSDDGTIDYREAGVVDYFFLTTDEWVEAFAILDILEERDEIQ
jgi:hypothetical protein